MSDTRELTVLGVRIPGSRWHHETINRSRIKNLSVNIINRSLQSRNHQCVISRSDRQIFIVYLYLSDKTSNLLVGISLYQFPYLLFSRHSSLQLGQPLQLYSQSLFLRLQVLLNFSDYPLSEILLHIDTGFSTMSALDTF